MLLRIIPIFSTILLLGGCAANGEYARRNPPAANVAANVVADVLRGIGKGLKSGAENNRSRIDVYHHSEE